MRRILYLLIIFLANSSLYAQQQTPHPKIALVLGGGGAKGFVHIGILRVLEQEGFPIDIIVGNSIGSIMGGLTAAGYKSEDLDKMARSQDWEMLLSDAAPRTYMSEIKQERKKRYLIELPMIGAGNKLVVPVGAVKGQNVLNIFNTLLANLPPTIDFDSLPIPFTCIGTSLLTGKEVDIRKGNLPRAMLSSMCVPGVFHPVSFENDLLVDGGVLNNFPVDVAKKMGGEIILGVDLRKPFKQGTDIITFGDVAGQLMDIVDLEKNNDNRKLCDILIEPNLEGYSSSSFSKDAVDTLIKRGEEAARAHLPEIRALIAKYNLKPNWISQKYVQRKSWTITKIDIPKNYSEQASMIKNRMNLEIGDTYTNDQLQDAITRVFAYGNFETVTYRLQPTDDGYTLALDLKDKYTSAIRAGFTMNTTEVAAVHLNYSYENYRTFFNMFSADAKFSVHPVGEFTLETHRPNFPTLGIKTGGYLNKISVYSSDNEIGDWTLWNIYTSVYASRRFWNVFNISLGIKDQYYHSQIFVKYNSNTNIPIDQGEIKNYVVGAFLNLAFDNLDDYYIPTKGQEVLLDFSLNATHKDIHNYITIFSLRYRSAVHLAGNFDLLSSLHYRSIYSRSGDIIPSLTNYSATEYNAFTSDYLPLLGQQGMGLLSDASAVAGLQLRIRFAKKYYIAPTVQLISQQDTWSEFANITFNTAFGVCFSTNTVLGPLDCKLGTNTLSRTRSITAGIGFKF